MKRENVTEILKNYRSYRYAVKQYERHRPFPQAGVANYSGMPGGSGAPELFFAPQGRMADMGHSSLQDRMDYSSYARMIDDIDGALDTLTDEEQSIVRLKWVEGVSLRDIADRKKYSIETVKRNHKRALEKLSICFRFIEIPQIETIAMRGSQHYHHKNREDDTFLTLL